MLAINPSKNELAVIRMMLESGLINYKHYMCWVDDIILREEEADKWVLELAATKSTGKAIQTLNMFINSEPFSYQGPTYNVSYVACIWLRYKRNEISWATFLKECGDYVDGNHEKVDCEYFYIMYNDIADLNYSHELEALQSEKVYLKFKDTIPETESIYNEFSPYYKKYTEVYGA